MERCCRARLALDGAECQAREHSRKVRREVKGSGTGATRVPREQSVQCVQRGLQPAAIRADRPSPARKRGPSLYESPNVLPPRSTVFDAPGSSTPPGEQT